jgi:hypothetical protein
MASLADDSARDLQDAFDALAKAEKPTRKLVLALGEKLQRAGLREEIPLAPRQVQDILLFAARFYDDLRPIKDRAKDFRASLARLLREDLWDQARGVLTEFAKIAAAKLRERKERQHAFDPANEGTQTTAREPHGAVGQDPARHTGDFRSVHWYGRKYSFTRTQAECVRFLWAAWKNGTPEVGQHYLLQEAKSDQSRLQDVFKRKGKRHPAWGTMIVPSRTNKGTCRLQEPEDSTRTRKSPR